MAESKEALPPISVATSMPYAPMTPLEPPVGVVAKWAVPASDLPLPSVTVYADRAEVTRALRVAPTETGQHDIVVRSLHRLVAGESVRVSVLAGHIKVLEVSYEGEEAEAAGVGEEGEELKALTQTCVELDDVIADCSRRKAIAVANTELLNAFTSEAVSPLPASPDGAPHALPDVEKLLDVRASRLEAAAALTRTLDADIRTLTDKRVEARKALAALSKGRKKGDGTKAVTISVSVLAPGDALLHLIYLVTSNASWTPSYDVRVGSQGSTVAVTYYGSIQQTTGEDWKDSLVTLSTASVGIGGTPPPMQAMTVSEVRRPVYRQQSKGGPCCCCCCCVCGGMSSAKYDESDSMPVPKEASAHMAAVVTSAQGIGASATFLIPRPATILSDGKPHKVVITELTLPASFRHYTVPQQAPQAYLQALCVNASAFTLLPSERVNVFFDGNFVAVASIPSVSPNQMFRTFLGVDPGVSVSWRDKGVVRSTGGVFTTMYISSHKYTTTIRNVKAVPVSVVLAVTSPTSGDSRIRVIQEEPSPSRITEGTEWEKAQRGDVFEDTAVGEVKAAATAADVREVALREVVARNPLTNNIVWSLLVPPNTAVAVPYEYRVEAPDGVLVALT